MPKEEKVLRFLEENYDILNSQIRKRWDETIDFQLTIEEVLDKVLTSRLAHYLVVGGRIDFLR